MASSHPIPRDPVLEALETAPLEDEEISEEEERAVEEAREELRRGERGITTEELLRKLAAVPFEDEEISEEERLAIEEADEEIRRGNVIPHEEVRRRWLAE